MPVADTFLDSNILLYTISPSEPAKQKIAISIVSSALKDSNAVISAQVVQECLNVGTGKLERAVPGSVRTWLSAYLMPLCTVFPSENLYLRAIDVKSRYGISFYDACIVAAALQAQVKTLLTEDLQDGQVIEDLTIKNPFRV